MRAAARLAPAGVVIHAYTDLGHLPPFNPDLQTPAPPAVVASLRLDVGRAAGLLIASPEYAHGIAAPLKTALDWLVASREFPGKPVMVINATQRATHADAQLREVLATMSARLVEKGSVTLPLWGRPLDADGILADPDVSALVRAAVVRLVAAIDVAAIVLPEAPV